MRTLILLALFGAVCVSAFDPTYLLDSYYTVLKTNDNTILGMNVVSQNADGINEKATISLGLADLANSYKLWPDHAFRMNSGSDILFTAAALKLVAAGVLPSLSTAIPAAFLPRGVTNFYNPSYTSVPITLEMLMRHTSSLTDTNFDSYRQAASAGSVATFVTFCETYFTTSSSGSYSAAQNIWSSLMPGAAASYAYARTNTALLAYVINAAILGTPTLVSGTTKDVSGYIQEQVIAPLGMASTFRKGTDGAFPKTSLPNGEPIYTGLPVVDISSAGAVKTDSYIHPAYPSDYMFYSTTENIGRLVRSLFIESNGIFASPGAQMKLSPLIVTSSSSLRTGQLMQGYGMSYYSGNSMCNVVYSTMSGYTCALTDSYTIWGTYAVGLQNMWGYFCITVSSVTTCTTVMLHYYETSSPRTPNLLLGAAAIVLSDAVSSSSSSGSQSSQSSSDYDEGLTGLWVALGVCLVIVFVLAAAYFTEYIVQPAPVPSGIVAAPPPIPQAYGHVDQGGMYGETNHGFYHD